MPYCHHLSLIGQHPKLLLHLLVYLHVNVVVAHQFNLLALQQGDVFALGELGIFHHVSNLRPRLHQHVVDVAEVE